MLRFVAVEYDPETVAYARLLDVFWANHDPTPLNRQGPDVGAHYRHVSGSRLLA